jgi:prevent-host-death family protein
MNRPKIPGPAKATSLTTALMDAAKGNIVRAIRVISPPTEFARGVGEEIRKQAAGPAMTTMEYRAAIAAEYASPNAEKRMVDRALVRLARRSPVMGGLTSQSAQMYIWYRSTSMPSVSTVHARNEFSSVLNRAAFGKERVILERRGKPIAAVVPIDDLRLLQKLEDDADIADAKAARREARKKGAKSLDQLRGELGE